MHEPWKMLMSCALMIRCSSEAVKTRCIQVGGGHAQPAELRRIAGKPAPSGFIFDALEGGGADTAVHC